MTYSDVTEYNVVGDTKTPLLRYIHKWRYEVKSGDIISTGQYLNYHSFSNLQFKKLSKHTFHSFKIELKDSTGEKLPFLSLGNTGVVLLFGKISNTHF